MFGWIRNNADTRRIAREFYGSIVAQARHETFYAAWGVADTPPGRLEVIVMHLVAALHRLALEGVAGRRLAFALNECFVTDMDDNMREMGIGDLTVPKRVKQAAAALFDRHRDYLAGHAAADDAALSQAIAAAFRLPQDDACVAHLVSYFRTLVGHLLTLPATAVLAGRVTFPEVPLPSLIDRT